MELESGTVEGHLGDALLLGALRERHADLLGSLDVAGRLQAVDERLLHRRRRDDRRRRVGRDDLRVDVARRAVHREAMRTILANVHARGFRPARADLLLGFHDVSYFFLASFMTTRSPR